MPRLHQFKVQYPGIDIHLGAPDAPVEFPRDDIAVVIREEFGAVCSPDLVQRCALVHPEALSGLAA